MRAGIFQRGRQPGLCAEDNNRVVKDAPRRQALSWHPVSWSAFLHSATAPVQPRQKHPTDGVPEALTQCGLRGQYRRSDAPRSSSDLHRNRCSHSALIRKTRRFPETMLARCWHHHAGQHDTARHDLSSCSGDANGRASHCLPCRGVCAQNSTLTADPVRPRHRRSLKSRLPCVPPETSMQRSSCDIKLVKTNKT